MDLEDSDWIEANEEEEKWNEPAEPHLDGLRLGVWQDGGHSSTANVSADRKSIAQVPSSSAENASIMSRMALNDNKAGMDGLDKEKINKIIMEASKGSRFYENERKKEAQVNQRIERMMQQLAGITGQQKAAALVEVDAMVAELEVTRHFTRSIVHLDMDAFYAAVEMRDNPVLKDKPMAVGSMSMLSTSNYHARRFGVRAAMPGFIGKKLCPELVIVPTNFDKYRKVSEQVREILAQYDSNFCPVSLDEAYFDLTDHLERRRGFSEAERTFEYRGWNEGAGGIEPSSTASNEDEESEGGTRSCSCGELLTTQRAHHREADEQDLMESVTKGEAGGVDILSTSRNRTDLLTQGSSPCLCADSVLAPSGPPLGSSGVGERGSSNPDGVEAVTSGQSRTFGFTVEEVVEEIRFRIEQRTQLTASAGIAPNVMLAKICSDKNKPNGQYRIQPTREAVMEFIRDLPIRKVSGIGKVTEKMLCALGIQNCTDLYQQRALLHLLFSPISSQHFLRISMGLGSTRVERDGERKSMSTERTFGELHRPADLYSKCNELCQALAEDLQKEELMGKTVTIKLKTVKFEVKTKAFSVPTCINTADSMFNVAKDLLRAEINACKPEPLRLRLMGVRLSNLQPCGAATSKQGSITEFFKKQRQTSVPSTQTPQYPEAQQGASGSDEKHRSQNSSSDSPQKGLGTDPTLAVPLDPKWKPWSSTSMQQADTPTLPVYQRSSGSLLTRGNLQTEEHYGHNGVGRRANQEDLPANEPAGASSELLCPVCNIPQPCADLETFNEHVDLCLNQGAIRDMLKQQASQDKPSLTRHSTSPTKGKRSLSGPKAAPKRRKLEKTQANTLDKFFS